MSGERTRDGTPVDVSVETTDAGLRIRVDEHDWVFESAIADDRQVRIITSDGRHHRLVVARRGHTTFVSMRGESVSVTARTTDEDDDTGEVRFVPEIVSPMPGKVLEVLVGAGDAVDHDTPLIRLEAMKMEQTIRSPSVARVREVRVKAGAMVGPGAVLLVLDPVDPVSG
jgi:biotin carboxyl carrier protein